MRRIPRPLAAVLGTALLLTACGGAASEAPATSPTPSGPPTADAEDPHAAHSAEEHAAATDTGDAGSTTEQTLAQLRAMDPDRLAKSHDHADQGHGEQHTEVSHPNGVDPARIVVPAIGVDADVIDLGLEDTGEMEVPTDFDQAGWFRNGPRPGRVGPAVIAGHVDDRDGPAVFYRLRELSEGDRIEVHGTDGEIVTFVVRGLEQHPKDAFPTERVYAGTPGAELRLITCGGDFDGGQGSYRDNVIVFAERVQA